MMVVEIIHREKLINIITNLDLVSSKISNKKKFYRLK